MRFNNFDSSESRWLAEQVDEVKSELYNIEYGEYRARELIPLDLNTRPHAETITYKTYNRIGMFKIISNAGQDLPKLDSVVKKRTVQVKHIGAEYGWTTNDIRIAMRHGESLDDQEGLMAREAHIATENKIAWHGSVEDGLDGLIEHPNAIEIVLPADGANGGTSLSSKESDAAKMYRDLVTIANTSAHVTNGKERADTLLLPMRCHTAISNAKYTDNETVLSFFLRNNPNIKMVDWLAELSNSSASGDDTYLVYKRDRRKLQLVTPLEFQQRAPQEVGLSINIPCEASCAGVVLHRPLSVAYAVVKDSK